MPNLTAIRSFGRGLCVEARYHVGRHDFARAMRCYLVAERLGRRVGRGSHLVLDMVGTTIRAAVQQAWLRELPAMAQGETAEFFDRNVAQLQDLPDASRSFVKAMDCEFDAEVKTFDRLVRDPALARSLAVDMAPDKKVFPFLLERDRKLYQRWYLETYALLQQAPSAGQRDHLEALQAGYWKEFHDKHAVFCEILGPNLAQAQFQDLKVQAGDKALAIACALYAYRADRGSFPASLDRLVPTYLAEVPSDPMNASAGFGYIPRGQDFTLYSFGPDGIDHHAAGVDFQDADLILKCDMIYHYFR